MGKSDRERTNTVLPEEGDRVDDESSVPAKFGRVGADVRIDHT